MNINRTIKEALQNQLTKYPILAVTGPRQSGKTTLLKTIFPEYTYLNLENPELREFALSDPKGFLTLYPEKIIFDEIQKTPLLFSYLQTIVDEQQQMGQFILSGSQNFQLLQNITQSLAGRVALFKLLPLDFDELKSEQLLLENPISQAIKGFYPAIYHREINSTTFYSNYIQTYVQRDVAELINVRDSKQFQLFLALCATRAGQLLNINSLAKDCGISQPTAKAWLSVLESSYLIFQLQPYHQNFSKRIIKTPKLYFYDTGLLAHLLKIHSLEMALQSGVIGALFENLVIANAVKQNYHKALNREFWFWRDSNGKEIDLILQDSPKLNLYELKATSTISQKLFTNLNQFATLAGAQVESKNLIYGGSSNQSRSDVSILAWHNL